MKDFLHPENMENNRGKEGNQYVQYKCI